ncbi:FkbM family methyltransferase [Poseidonibacter antarcticus]|uniref:FkbM family methyltransferase n=1 Tax=Poseidonibacter antarcticus TaxID=2478538 RepID=UPI000EF46B5D|nr:FkbM family methyltransferase [Poseidonibacter antarcticus]
MNLVGFDYINQRDKKLVELFISSNKTKKYILGINKLGKSVLKHLEVDGIIDDFTRVQSSRKKTVLKIQDVPKDSIILTVATGSPLEVKIKLDELGYTHFNYLAFIRYSKLDLVHPPFIMDFKDDFLKNESKYQETYDLLEDKKSKEIFTKILNFKMTFDLDFMEGFTNNHKEQYFDKEIIPKIKNINFVDGGAYVGDTLPQIINNFPDYNKIYCIEPNDLHLKIAKRDFPNQRDIEFINCGLGKEKITSTISQDEQNNCSHDYHAQNINTIDNLINEKIDFIKMDIEGAEQDAIKGATNTIKLYHPILAICIYHKAEDWYKVPKMVLNIKNDYKIYLRHYMEGIFETVMYFIPKS